MAYPMLDLISIERQGSRLIVDFSSESDAAWLEQLYRDKRPTSPFNFSLSTVDVEEGRTGAGVADVMAEGADIDQLIFACSDDRFVVRGSDGQYDLMLRDNVALSYADEPTVPLTITAKAQDGSTAKHSYAIEVLPSYNEPETKAEPETGEDISGTETQVPMPDPVAFGAPVPDNYTLVYRPLIDMSEDVKHNLMMGEFGGTYSGSWDYKEAIELINGDPSCIRTHMEKGSHAGTKDRIRGAGFDTRTLNVDRAMMTYIVRFKDQFEFVKGGKLPGLMGGDSPSGGSDALNGFSARMMWRQDGQGELYLYAMNKHNNYGRSIGRGDFTFVPGVDHEIAQEVSLNTVGRADGWIRIWFDGAPVLEQNGIVFRDDSDVLIEGLMHTIFFGGSDDSWGAAQDEYIDTADFRIYTP